MGDPVRDDFSLSCRMFRFRSRIFQSGDHVGLSIFGSSIQIPSGAMFSFWDLYSNETVKSRSYSIHTLCGP